MTKKLELKFTEKNQTYIRIIDPENQKRNLGYISSNGEISVKKELKDDLIFHKMYEEYEWLPGSGRNSGTGFDSHISSPKSLYESLLYIRRLATKMNAACNFNLID